ncbi:hypothetical protein BLNAU_8938 [Blattamonas nauphoetae]|uniref:Protein kinase domain-containing protein n=1 Tax=Blattamonas nauphoetae TaxID=2049346 RepID=A0ABQ9XXG3_9EUKA|nr:hypothetical protein BLNAU_8938 [Blattamonas nauphoetae]
MIVRLSDSFGILSENRNDTQLTGYVPTQALGPFPAPNIPEPNDTPFSLDLEYVTAYPNVVDEVKSFFSQFGEVYYFDSRPHNDASSTYRFALDILSTTDFDTIKSAIVNQPFYSQDTQLTLSRYKLFPNKLLLSHLPLDCTETDIRTMIHPANPTKMHVQPMRHFEIDLAGFQCILHVRVVRPHPSKSTQHRDIVNTLFPTSIITNLHIHKAPPDRTVSAVVHFKTESEAQQAISQSGSLILHSNRIHVRERRVDTARFSRGSVSPVSVSPPPLPRNLPPHPTNSQSQPLSPPRRNQQSPPPPPPPNRNLGIMDSSLKLQGNWNTKIILDERAIHSNRFSALLCISNSSVELDGLQLDAYHNHPNIPHRRYSSRYAGQSISVLSICSSSIVVSNSKIYVPRQQSPFVITCSEHSGGDEMTRICVKSSSLFSSSSISGATTLILPNARHLGLCISMMSCTIDSTQIVSDSGLLVQVAHSPRSNKNCGRIETLLSGNHIENVTRTSSGHFNPSHQGVWSQRLFSNSITNSTSVLCGSVVRDMNLGGDLLITNTSFVSCATSSVQPIPRRGLELNIFRPYLGPNLRKDKSVADVYEWEEKNFGKGTLFDFFDYHFDGGLYYDEGTNFLFSSFSHTIRFTCCIFTDIDGKDENEEYRYTDGAAIIIRCSSPLLVEYCQFSNCGGGMHGGVIDISLENERTTTSITSTSFEECWSKASYSTSSVLHHHTRGIITLTASNFSNFKTASHSDIISCDGIIVSNCLFNYNGSLFSHALDVALGSSQFLYTSFSSDSQAYEDVGTPSYSLKLWSFLGCISNSQQACSLAYIGLSPLTIEVGNGEVVVEPDLEPDTLQTALDSNAGADTFILKSGRYGTFEIDSRDLRLKQWHPQDSLNPTAPVATSFSLTVKAGAECWISVFQLAPLDESSSLVTVSTQGMCKLRDVVVDQIDELAVPFFSATGPDANLTLSYCQITNIRNAAANLIQATDGAQISLENSIITHISTTQTPQSLTFTEQKERDQLHKKLVATNNLPFDVPIVQKPVTITQHRLLWKSEYGVGYYTSVLLQQDPETLTESMFTIQDSPEVEIQTFTIQLESQTSSPLVKVDTSSRFVMWDCVVFGDAGQFHRPFLESSGIVEFDFCHFSGLSFNGHSCIDILGGYFNFVADTEPKRVSSVVNVSTTGKGTFLSSFHGDSVGINQVFFVNCSAEAGGAVYIEDTEDVDFESFFAKSVHFDEFSDRIEDMKEDICSTSRQSTNLSIQCQVYFESSPSDSFDFSLPEFKLNGSSTDVDSPYTSSELHSFRAITPFLHVMDDRGKMINMTVGVGDEFCIFERGFCSSQHISFIKEAESGDSSVKIKRDEESPLYDLVALELDADAVIEFHNLIFAIECPFQMMLVKHHSARGLIETCEFSFESGMELPLPLFEVEDGTLSLTQTLICIQGDEGTLTVNDFVLTAAPLILVAPADSAASSPTVILDDVTLRRMRLKEGVASLMLFDFSASVEVNEVEFIDCNQTDSKEATRIIATGSNLEEVDFSKWKGFDSLADPADPLSWAIDKAESAESIWHTIPLRIAFVRFEGQSITVEQNGRDLAGCGEGSWNCRGLARAGKNVGGNQPCTITIVESSFLNGEFDPPAKRTSVESSSSKSVIVVEREGRMVNSPDGGQAPILTLSHLSFSLPPIVNTDSLIESLGGELTVKDCWFVSSSLISFYLLSATSGVVEIEKIVVSDLKYSSTLIKLVGLESATIQSLTLSDLPEVALVSAEGQPSKKWTLAITRSTFTGKSTSSNETPTDSEKLCSWESGLVVLKECVCEISWTTFSKLGQGAIHATNSNVTLRQIDLAHNGLPSTTFPSARQNIRCVGTGIISFESFSAGSILAENDMWVSTDDECVVDGENFSPRHAFFEPSLITKNCSSEFVKKEDRYSVEIVGTKLVPCGLSLEVFEDDSSSANEVKHEVIDLFELTTNWTETSISLSLPASRLSTLSNSPRWLARIEFGKGHTTESFELKMSAKKARTTILSHTLPWLIPLIVVIIVAIIVVIVVIVVLQRRKTKEPEPGNEMETQDNVEVEKLEDVDHTPSNAPNSALTTIESKALGVCDQTVQQHMMASGVWSQKDQFVEALACSGQFQMEVVRKTDTLYDRLHTEQGRKIALTKEAVRQQLVKGILKIWETDKSAKILTKLSSHVVIVDAANNVFLNVQGEQAVSNGEGPEADRQAQIVEARRWSPPEIDNENSIQNSIDISKAAVFSLGLILWEMETDSVPFGEVDAVNAQRQMGVGSTLNMDGVKNSKMKEMIEMCLSTDPNDRPTLSELNEFINPEPKIELPPQPNDPTA